MEQRRVKEGTTCFVVGISSFGGCAWRANGRASRLLLGAPDTQGSPESLGLSIAFTRRETFPPLLSASDAIAESDALLG